MLGRSGGRMSGRMARREISYMTHFLSTISEFSDGKLGGPPLLRFLSNCCGWCDGQILVLSPTKKNWTKRAVEKEVKSLKNAFLKYNAPSFVHFKR